MKDVTPEAYVIPCYWLANFFHTVVLRSHGKAYEFYLNHMLPFFVSFSRSLKAIDIKILYIVLKLHNLRCKTLGKNTLNYVKEVYRSVIGQVQGHVKGQNNKIYKVSKLYIGTLKNFV